MYPWGWPDETFKDSIGLVTEKDNGDLTLTYDKLEKAKRTLKPNATDEKTNRAFHTQIYMSRPYISSAKDPEAKTCVKILPPMELEEINFGIKQKGPMYYFAKDGVPRYSLGDHLEGKEPFGSEGLDELKPNSVHGLAINKTAVNMAGRPKQGRGPKFFNRGNNGCINAIVTRFDRYGNVQMMAMVRPKRADSDPGDFQMSAGCLFFAEELEFNGHKIPRMTSTPFGVTSGSDNVEESGALKGKGLAYARGAIYSKLWHGEEFKSIIEGWDFYKVSEGIVDDVSNTTESWVETSYNVHHVTGEESTEELAKLADAKVNKERANVGFGVWRSIDADPADPSNVYSQMYVEQEGGEYKSVQAKHEGSAIKFDAFAEFDLWHGEHSFAARMVADYVKEKFEFIGPVDDKSPFGRSKAKA